jgi:hypothetical protein
MMDMKDFFQEFFTNLPPLEFRPRKYTRAKVIVYSDTRVSRMRSGLGFVVIEGPLKLSGLLSLGPRTEHISFGL